MLPTKSLCKDPASNWTTRRSPDHRKETQTTVVWTCLPFFRSGQNHLARHSERGKKTRQTEEEAGRQRQGMEWPGVHKVPEGSGEQGKVEETGCEVICGAQMTLAVKGQMMIMIMNVKVSFNSIPVLQDSEGSVKCSFLPPTFVNIKLKITKQLRPGLYL